MYCGNCGTEIKGNPVYCPNCGQRISKTETPENREIKFKKSINKKLLIPIIMIFLIILIIVAISLGGKGYEKTVDKYFKAIETQDVSLMKSVLADYWIDYEIADYDTDKYLISDLEDLINEDIHNYDCGNDIKITYTITSKKRANKEDLLKLKKNIYDWYAYYVYDEDEFNKSITDAYVLSIRFTVYGDEGTDKFTTEMLVIKENGKWKRTLGGLDNSFYSNY